MYLALLISERALFDSAWFQVLHLPGEEEKKMRWRLLPWAGLGLGGGGGLLPLAHLWALAGGFALRSCFLRFLHKAFRNERTCSTSIQNSPRNTFFLKKKYTLSGLFTPSFHHKCHDPVEQWAVLGMCLACARVVFYFNGGIFHRSFCTYYHSFPGEMYYKEYTHSCPDLWLFSKFLFYFSLKEKNEWIGF